MATMGSFFKQLFCTIIVCLLSLNVGIIISWPSSTYNLFESSNTTLHRPMSTTEMSLFGSLSSFGAMVWIPFVGYFLDSFGRKNCTIVASLMQVIAWALLALSNRTEVVLTAVFLSGSGGIMFLVQPLYIAEFCEEKIRGTLSSIPFIMYSTGMMLSYLMGGLIAYISMIYTCLSITVLSVILLFVLKESPVLLMKKGLESEAAKSMCFFRNMKLNSNQIHEEMDTIKRILNAEKYLVSQEEEKLNSHNDAKDERFSIWQFLQKSKSTRKALSICFIMCFLANVQGLVAVQVYAEPIFLEAVPSISPTLCTFLLGLFNILAGIGTSYLIDIAGRKRLMVYSCMIGGISSMVLAMQLQLRWAPDLLTAALIYVFCLSCVFGGGTVTYVVIAEVFLPEIKSFASALLIEWAWVSTFIALFVHNPLSSVIGLSGMFYVFGAISFALQIFCLVYLPETKGLPVDQIQALFVSRNNKI